MSKLGLGIIIAALAAVGCGDDDDTDGTGADAGNGGDAGEAQAFAVPLTAEEEAPTPCVGAGADATGEATVTISENGSEVSVELSWSGLSGDATAAHIHLGAEGVAGDVIFPFDMPPTSPVEATFTEADYPDPVPAGAPADFAAFIAVMEGGGSYLNVHTMACMPGEIRGQID